jgi:hypothetical protein
MSQALLAKAVNAVTKDATTIHEQFLSHVKVTWLTYILEHAKPKSQKQQAEEKNMQGVRRNIAARIMPAPVMLLIIRLLDDAQWDNYNPTICRLADQLVKETQDRGWLDDINPKYTACLLQLACDDSHIWDKSAPGVYLSTNVPQRKSKEFLLKLKVPIQQRIWTKKEFAIKLINPTDRQRRLLEKSTSCSDFFRQQHHLKRLQPKQDHLIHVPIFNVFVPKDFHLLGNGLKHYKQLLKKHGRENREAREIRLEFLREANLELRPAKEVFVGLGYHEVPCNFTLNNHVMPQFEVATNTKILE